MPKKVLITSRSFGKLSSEPMDILREAGFEAENMGLDFDPVRFEQVLPECDALIIGAHALEPELLDRCPRLKIICKHGVGLDNIPLEKARSLGIAVTNTPGTNSEAVADLAFGLMLDVSRSITRSAAHVRAGMGGQDVGVDVFGKTLGLMGFGRIAQAVARRATGFNMKVLAYDPYVSVAPAGLEYVALKDRDDVIRECDILSMHLPLTQQTQDFIGEREIALMKDGAILVNTARGGVVNEDALCAALKAGKLRGAGLDVTKREPTPKDDPLLQFENVVITNHIGMYSREAITAVSLLCAEAVRDLFAGKQPRNRVA